MKILVISTFPPLQMPDADFAYRLCRNLADTGLEVHVLCQKGAVAGDVPRLHTHPFMETWNWREGLTLAHLVRRLRPDAVLLVYTGNAFGHRPMLTFSASIVKRLRPRARFVTLIPFPLGAHSGYGISRKFHQFLLKSSGAGGCEEYGTLLQDSVQIVVMSNRHLPDLERHSPRLREKSVLIPPALIMPLSPEDQDIRRQIRHGLGVPEDDFLFAFFGYPYPTKGLETLIPAFGRLRQRRQGVKLVMVGGGRFEDDANPYLTGIKAMIQDLGITDDVRFTGGFSWDSDLGSRYLRAVDAAVLPFDQGVSLNNSSFASVTTHGLPTVTTRGDVVEVPIAHRRNVFLCRPQDPEALAEAMDAVAADGALRETLRAGSLELARTCFSWHSATERYVASLTGAEQRSGVEEIISLK